MKSYKTETNRFNYYEILIQLKGGKTFEKEILEFFLRQKNSSLKV